jgi:hypothetical protein
MRLDQKNGARLATTGKPNDIAHTTVTACGADWFEGNAGLADEVAPL